MTNEELILEKLENLENQIQPLIKTSEKFAELKNDLIPIGNHATALLINELTEVEAGFKLDCVSCARVVVLGLHTSCRD